jgi:hypothetical protein
MWWGWAFFESGGEGDVFIGSVLEGTVTTPILSIGNITALTGRVESPQLSGGRYVVSLTGSILGSEIEGEV